jgi:hypothetical protein
MTRHILFVGLCAATVYLLPVDAAFADHCRCGGGYSIGGCTTPATAVPSGTVYYSSPATSGYYYSPQYYSPGNSYYRSYPSYGYSRPGFSISIGSGFGSRFGSGFGNRPYGYSSFGSRYGYSGFGFGSSISRHHHHHH